MQTIGTRVSFQPREIVKRTPVAIVRNINGFKTHFSFRYLGDGGFVVERAENSKLKVGDTFSASLFILHEPLYLSRLVQGSKPPVSFVVGNKDGLCEIERIPGQSELSQVDTERA